MNDPRLVTRDYGYWVENELRARFALQGVPVSIDFQEAVGAPLVISGIAQADSAVHSPNERLVIDNYHRGIEAVIRFICGMALE